MSSNNVNNKKEQGVYVIKHTVYSGTENNLVDELQFYKTKKDAFVAWAETKRSFISETDTLTDTIEITLYWINADTQEQTLLNKLEYVTNKTLYPERF